MLRGIRASTPPHVVLVFGTRPPLKRWGTINSRIWQFLQKSSCQKQPGRMHWNYWLCLMMSDNVRFGPILLWSTKSIRSLEILPAIGIRPPPLWKALGNSFPNPAFSSKLIVKTIIIVWKTSVPERWNWDGESHHQQCSMCWWWAVLLLCPAHGKRMWWCAHVNPTISQNFLHHNFWSESEKKSLLKHENNALMLGFALVMIRRWVMGHLIKSSFKTWVWVFVEV